MWTLLLPDFTNKMTQTQTQYDYNDYEDYEHDDIMTADDYERRQYQRDGWNESRYDRQYW